MSKKIEEILEKEAIEISKYEFFEVIKYLNDHPKDFKTRKKLRIIEGDRYLSNKTQFDNKTTKIPFLAKSKFASTEEARKFINASEKMLVDNPTSKVANLNLANAFYYIGSKLNDNEFLEISLWAYEKYSDVTGDSVEPAIIDKIAELRIKLGK